MSKHTQGPWEFDGNTLVGPKIDDKPVWLRPVILRSETGVSEGDARLIAAAPDLLHQRDYLMSTIIAAAALAPIDSPCKRLLDEAISNMKGGA